MLTADGVADQPGAHPAPLAPHEPRPPAVPPLDPLTDPDPRYRHSAERCWAAEEIARELGLHLEAPAVGMTWLVPGAATPAHRRAAGEGSTGA